MKRFTLYIAALVFTFYMSTIAAYVWEDRYWSTGVGSFVMCGNIEKGFSGSGGFSSYVFYDKTNLARYNAGFDSIEEAQSCYQSELQKAEEIVERETLYDESHNRIVGQRVVAVFQPNEYTRLGWTRIMVLKGDHIIEITSPSLRHALNFEKSYRK